MTQAYITIINFLKENNIQFEEIEHEPVFTSEQAASIRGSSLEEGAKSLLLKYSDNFVLAVLPGGRKLDSKKLKNVTGAKEIRFATPEEVVIIMGCEIGSCYPFGNLINVRMIVDPSLMERTNIIFNPGVHNKSIKIKKDDYIQLVKPEVVEISVTQDFEF